MKTPVRDVSTTVDVRHVHDGLVKQLRMQVRYVVLLDDSCVLQGSSGQLRAIPRPRRRRRHFGAAEKRARRVVSEVIESSTHLVGAASLTNR